MSIQPKDAKKTKNNRRRVKKRRTEDFSDSSSSESSDSESEEEKEDDNEAVIDQDGDAVLSDIDVENGDIPNEDFGKVKGQLQTISLTTTQLNETNKNINRVQINDSLNKGRKELENDYLGLMFENYGDDINELRTASDFNERSLSILANALKNGSNIFDEDTLRAVVTKLDH